MKSNLIMGGGGDFIFHKTFSIILLLLVASVYTAPTYDRLEPRNSTFTDLPSITSVDRLDENTLRVRWDIVNHDTQYLTRYRLFFTIDGDDMNELFEWPAQIKYAGNQMIGTAYRSFTLRNAFECYSWCQTNPVCTFATFRSLSNKFDSHPSCFMKTKLDESKPGGNFSFGHTIEHVIIEDYKNEAILRGLPTNIGYSFTLVLYDSKLDDWSSESPIYHYSPPQLETQLTHEFNDNRHVFSWTPPRSGQDEFTISRYNLIVWPSNQPYKKKTVLIKDGISKYKFEPDYYNVRFDPIFTNDEQACYENCVAKPSCVRYVFHTKMNNCYLLPEIDLTKSQLVLHDAVAYSLKRESNQFRLNSPLIPFTDYNAQIEMITPYGVSTLSNLVKFQSDKEDFVDDGSSLPAIDRPDKPKQTTKKAETTSNQQQQQQEIDDYFVDSNEKEPEIDENGGGENGSSGENEVVALEINMPSSQSRSVNERFEIECTFYGSTRKTLVWSKVGDEWRSLTTETRVATGEDNGRKSVTSKLVFESLTRKDEGNYSCYAQDTPNEKLLLNLNVKSAPSKPIIEKAVLSEDGLYLKWWLDDNGGLDAFKGAVELKTDIQGLDDSMVEVFELNSDDLKMRQTTIKDTRASKGTFATVWIENAFGRSEKSEAKNIEGAKQDEDKPTTNNQQDLVKPVEPIAEKPIEQGGGGATTASAVLGTENPAENVSDGKSRPSTWNILIMLAAILILFILGYAVYRCKFAGDKNSTKSNKEGQDEENAGAKESEPLKKQQDE